jgi:hypothetical protein
LRPRPRALALDEVEIGHVVVVDLVSSPSTFRHAFVQDEEVLAGRRFRPWRATMP